MAKDIEKIVKQGTYEEVYLDEGMNATSGKWVDTEGQEAALEIGAGMDCPLCASVSVPAPAAVKAFEKLSPLAHALQPLAVAHIASSTAPPLPSRGPPSIS
jgi:hypothetical protein